MPKGAWVVGLLKRVTCPTVRALLQGASRGGVSMFALCRSLAGTSMNRMTMVLRTCRTGVVLGCGARWTGSRRPAYPAPRGTVGERIQVDRANRACTGRNA